MRRVSIAPRDNWQATVESQGLHFHSPDGEPYWDESACYLFDAAEIDAIEAATYALDDMCLKACEFVIENNLLDTFNVPPAFQPWLRESWEKDEHTVYGRFDLAYSPGTTPRLLEYNADTPTALLEAAVIQWNWLKDTQHGTDQFNSIHERLIEAWKTFTPDVEGTMYFCSLAGNVEDYMTVNYLRDTAMQAGLTTAYLEIEQIAWDERAGQFVDARRQPLRTVFKLYPWEWMLRDEFGRHLPAARCRWFEPPWKMLLSNKAILPILWQLYPGSPYLLQADYEPIGPTYIHKPMQGREGANVKIVRDGQTIFETDGPYQDKGVYQEICPLPNFDGRYPVIGSWLVNGYACGLGIREDSGPVTGNTSRFVPHAISSGLESRL